jgi:hypothetical protein
MIKIKLVFAWGWGKLQKKKFWSQKNRKKEKCVG